MNVNGFALMECALSQSLQLMLPKLSIFWLVLEHSWS